MEMWCVNVWCKSPRKASKPATKDGSKVTPHLYSATPCFTDTANNAECSEQNPLKVALPLQQSPAQCIPPW